MVTQTNHSVGYFFESYIWKSQLGKLFNVILSKINFTILWPLQLKMSEKTHMYVPSNSCDTEFEGGELKFDGLLI